MSGNGVIGFAMQNDIPVIHMLNIKSISERVGIPYDSKPSKMGPGQVGIVWSLLGLALFIIILLLTGAGGWKNLTDKPGERKPGQKQVKVPVDLVS